MRIRARKNRIREGKPRGWLYYDMIKIWKIMKIKSQARNFLIDWV
jgi:hypothetical protein